MPVIKNYQMVRAIGSGGMSTVYEAIDSKLKRPVAIKVLHAHLYSDTMAVERFRREACAAARMDHPNIVRIYDYLYAGNTHCIIMEYVQGPDLESVIRTRGALPFDIARTVMIEVAEALREAHGQGIMHRDIKPSNILIQRGERVMLSDFGLARRVVDGRLTQQDAVAGTPCFMSPEQIGNLGVEFSSDIYSWAVTFYNLFTGTLPYRHQKFPDVIADIQGGKVVIDHQQCPLLPAKWLALLERCLVSDPLERIQDGAALCAAIEACGSEPRADLAPYMNTAADTSPAPGMDSEVSVTQIYRAHKMGPVQMALLLVGCIAIAAGLFLATLWYLDREGIGASASSTQPSPADTAAAKATLVAEKVAEEGDSVAFSSAARAPRPTEPSAPAAAPRSVPTPAAARDSGQLFVYSDPWANIAVNGKDYGRTPLEKPITLPRGTHLIRLYNDFCEPLEEKVLVISNTVIRKRYSLRVKPAYQ